MLQTYRGFVFFFLWKYYRNITPKQELDTADNRSEIRKLVVQKKTGTLDRLACGERKDGKVCDVYLGEYLFGSISFSVKNDKKKYLYIPESNTTPSNDDGDLSLNFTDSNNG